MITIQNILDAEKYLNDISTVIFDLDDTLYPEKDYVRSGYQKIAAYFGQQDLEKQMWDVFLKGGKAIDEVFQKAGLSEHKEKALYIYREQVPDIELYSGVREMLERLSIHKKIGIITDGRPRGQRAKLKVLNIRADKVIITDELGGIEYRKPNKKAFEIMREYFDVPYEEMIYIGDNLKKDFIAPEELGMRCIWFQNPDGLYNK